MFSRSKKTEEVIDPMAEPSKQRSPMVMAALAGLLAIAGAFLLVLFLTNGQDGTAAFDSNGEAISAPAEANRQVLVVVEMIPRGTSVSELIAAPTVYLSARAVPEQFVAATAIASVAELRELDGMILSSDALPGEQLLQGRFRDPNDFESNTDTFLENQVDIEIPPGHHAIVLDLPARSALGGLLRKGELVTVIANARITPTLNGQPSREISVVVLNSVEVLNVDSTLEVAGQVSSSFDTVGVASQGSFRVTLAVLPTELTDLTFAISYTDIMLATAIPGLENEGTPRAATWMRQIMGDDGIWLEQLEDGNIIPLIEIFPPITEEGTSIEVELPEQGSPPATNVGDDGTDLAQEDSAGDS